MKMVLSYAIGKLNGNLLGGKKKGSAIAGPFSYDRENLLRRGCQARGFDGLADLSV